MASMACTKVARSMFISMIGLDIVISGIFGISNGLHRLIDVPNVQYLVQKLSPSSKLLHRAVSRRGYYVNCSSRFIGCKCMFAGRFPGNPSNK